MSKKTTVSGILLVLLVLATTPLLGTDSVPLLKWWLMTVVLGIFSGCCSAVSAVS